MKLPSWKLAEKLHKSNKKGIITGLVIALIVIAIVVAVIVKLQWLKSYFGCAGCDDLDDDFDLEFEDDDNEDFV